MDSEEAQPAISPPRILVTKMRVAILLLLMVASPFLYILSLECWRQYDISRAKDEFKRDLQTAIAPYQGVEDWPSWYRAKVEGNWGGDKYSAWCNDAVHGPHASPKLDFELEAAIVERLKGRTPFEYADPDPLALQAFIDDSDVMASRADNLLRFDDLGGIPTFDGVPSWPILEPLLAMGMLVQRIQVLTFQTRYSEAWNELGRLWEILARLRTCSSVAEYMVRVGAEGMFHSAFADLCRDSTPPGEAGDWFPMPPPIDHTQELFDCEGAYLAQLLGDVDWDTAWDEFDDDDGNEAWFAWVGYHHSQSEREDIYERPAATYRLQSEYFRDLAQMREAAANGESIGVLGSQAENTMERVRVGYAKQLLLRQRSNLLFKLRTAELNRMPLAEVVQSDEETKSMVLSNSAEGWLVEWRDTTELRTMLWLDANDDLEDDWSDPILLKVLSNRD